MNARPLAFGTDWSYNIHNDPKRLAFVLARYYFAAQMAEKGCWVAELGCNEGIGIPTLLQVAGAYLGVDMDTEAIAVARANWQGPGVDFVGEDFLGRVYGTFDVVVSFDVVEHIEAQRENLYFSTVYRNLRPEGVAIVGTPNISSEAYASEASRVGHINLFNAERLKQCLARYFHNVFVFSMNDEVVHVGFAPLAHYLIGLGCYRKECEPS